MGLTIEEQGGKRYVKWMNKEVRRLRKLSKKQMKREMKAHFAYKMRHGG